MSLHATAENNREKVGSLTEAIGPVYSGKTTWVMNKINRLSRCQGGVKRKILIVRFNIDTRSTRTEALTDHNGHTITKGDNTDIVAVDLEDLLTMDVSSYDIILVEEIHLAVFGTSLKAGHTTESAAIVNNVYDWFYKLVYLHGKRMYVTGNDFWKDFTPVKIMRALTRLARKVKTFRSKCDICGADGAATLTIAKVEFNGMIRPGNQETWMAVCPPCAGGKIEEQ
jgi:thymidine kinase